MRTFQSKYAGLFLIEQRRIEELKAEALSTYLWLKDRADRNPEELIFILRHAVRIGEDIAKAQPRRKKGAEP